MKDQIIDKIKKKARLIVQTYESICKPLVEGRWKPERMKKYMDGDIIFAFNQVKVDSELSKSGKGGEYIKSANYFHIKHAGGPVMDVKEIRRRFGTKIASYVPKNVAWG